MMLYAKPNKELTQGTYTPITGTYISIDTCDICNGKGYYRDYSGKWHKCPKCCGNIFEVTC